MSKVEIILTVLFLVFGLVLLVMIFSYLKKKRRCTVEVDAVITGYSESVSHDIESGDSVSYAPIYSYYFDGRTYDVESSSYTSSMKYNVGETVPVLIDPDQPERFFDKSRERAVLLLFLAIFGGFMVLSVIGMIFNIDLE